MFFAIFSFEIFCQLSNEYVNSITKTLYIWTAKFIKITIE